MTLSFSTKWPQRMGELHGQPNYFLDKIWAGLIDNSLACKLKRVLYWRDDYFDKSPSEIRPKLHTIRHDQNNRWKADNNIHMVINNRTSNRYQFAPVIKCKSVQRIEIEHLLDRDGAKRSFVSIDGILLTIERINTLAINDGFPTVEAFFSFFNTDFTGKIIHWTNLKY